MYGDEHCSPNMHAICHLTECIRLFGPVHGHWTFPWERMNGIMGSTPMNRHDVELQFARHWTRLNTLRVAPTLSQMPLTDPQDRLFSSLFGSVKSAERGCSGSDMIKTYTLIQSDGRVSGTEKIAASLLDTSGPHLFTRPQRERLIANLRDIFPHSPEISIPSSCYTHAKRLQLYGDVIGTRVGRYERSSYVLCYAVGRLRAAQCQHFLRFDATITWNDGTQQSMTFTMAEVRWYDRYGPEAKDGYVFGPLGDTVDKWYLEPSSDSKGPTLPRYLPIHRIACRFVMAPCTEDDTPQLARQKKRKRDEPPLPLPKKLFRTCPLPLQIPL
jgi:hypothetical protein